MRCWICCCIWMLFFIPNLAFADNEEARQLFLSGEAAYQIGDYHRAIEDWKRAFKISKRPRFQYNIAQAYDRLGELTDAIAALELYLETIDPVDSKKSDAEKLLASLQKRLSATGILIKNAPDHSAILINNKPWGYTPREKRIPVQPGFHTVIIEKKGQGRFKSSVFVPVGKITEVFVELKEKKDLPEKQPLDDNIGTLSSGVDQSSNTPAKSTEYHSNDSDDSTPILYIISAALTAGSIGSAIWMADRIDNSNQCDNPAPGIECDNADQISLEKVSAITTTVVLGTAAISVFIAALFSGYSDEVEESESATCFPTLKEGAGCVIRF